MGWRYMKIFHSGRPTILKSCMDYNLLMWFGVLDEDQKRPLLWSHLLVVWFFRLGALRAWHLCDNVDVVMEAGLDQYRDYPDHRWLMTLVLCATASTDCCSRDRWYNIHTVISVGHFIFCEYQGSGRGIIWNTLWAPDAFGRVAPVSDIFMVWYPNAIPKQKPHLNALRSIDGFWSCDKTASENENMWSLWILKLNAVLSKLLVATWSTVMLKWHYVQQTEIYACLSLHDDVYIMVWAR